MNSKVFRVFLIIPLLLVPVSVLVISDQSNNQSTYIAISAVASFLFGLLATYTLQDRHTRIANIVKNGSIERAELVFIYEGLQIFPEKSQKIVLEKMDKYLITNIDLEVKYFYKTDEPFRELFDTIINLKVEDKNKDSCTRSFCFRSRL